ncbi:ubiquinone/menaquinone biosynthesis C-methylase UbiE [Arthrobacter pigmenti]|uniref:Ubiquinone/menaquinone biosynthesis C-methylase UbiE n=1 Tax=Arthrobacter pigmenti TaxID=271432 RepID=A0A846RT76_9MICC|nr:class I SAM-dependent methyltransferase [Arthrobacter pigmenti]NJC22875.1 ubiquinone/menaquinone biosynthesis C-methylase UbiE [Arthrobacter pigmenti]
MVPGGPRLAAHRRRTLARGYLQDGERYDRVRPGYPDDCVDWLVPASAVWAIDIGAGTGKFTRELVRRSREVVAVDPSSDMLAVLSRSLPDVRTVEGTAESTGLPASSAGVVTIAQAWHWCDPVETVAEAARILAPEGVLALVWNQLDVSVPWVHRLSRIMHAGDVFRPSYRPLLGARFTKPESRVFAWTQLLSASDVVELARSRSYYQNASVSTRARVDENLRWYLHEHLGHPWNATLELPYLTYAWRATRSSS